ncbi:helix-turn-helix transcriptional regulator [Natronoglycomyces albus]|uniref:Helix-turn-helix transcriptional regulator n=1 Tax=Natronoglycomyces albus TaxID=2811108 RepID=A0A895XNE2_9ACTN|nr:helix-turn-helix transcriptional regulator [Natronoglycomyces albus]QSB06637.1 helix-turn-helix transcriptional regulator [Natronoglycomyces albus]
MANSKYSYEEGAIDQVIGLLHDLNGAPEDALRPIVEIENPQQATDLAQVLVALCPDSANARWLRSLMLELFFSTGRLTACLDLAREMQMSNLPTDIKESAWVAELMCTAQLDSDTAVEIARSELRRRKGRLKGSQAAIICAVVIADRCWSRGALEEGLAWVKRVDEQLDGITSAYWHMHVGIDVALKLVDVGQLQRARDLWSLISNRSRHIANPCVEVGLQLIDTTLNIHQGRWHYSSVGTKQVDADGKTPCLEFTRPYQATLYAMQSVAASYAGQGEAASELLRLSRRCSKSAAGTPLDPVDLWAEILIEDATSGSEGVRTLCHKVFPQNTHLQRALFALIPGAAAFLTQAMLELKDAEAAYNIGAQVDRLRRDNPGIATMTWVADHVTGLLEGSVTLLGSIAQNHPHAWVRYIAATHLIAAVTSDRPAPAVDIESVTDEKGSSRWQSLSSREKEIALLAAEGLTNQQISSRIFRSPHTVSFHLRNIYRKMQISSRAEIGKHLPKTEV